ncbi:RsiV family protein [Bacillus sp. FJAT-45350]|uniref:RsiV family protein n=1 Tax=Bacillus sp. FJAT-45350 TaxID=2011014 RepID=UPI000BB79A35|nr:RsiV family protein [Bacillus sp. FJAT-45350]
MNYYQLPIPVESKIITAPQLSITYPQISWPINFHIQHKLNSEIVHEVEQLFQLVNQQGYFEIGKTNLVGGYEIKNNQRGILSLTLSNSAMKYTMAHPVEHLTSMTSGLRTGKIYSLGELFKPNSHYEAEISRIVKKQIEDRNLPLYEEFQGIKPNQEFYLADKTLVIYFQRYEIGPRPMGFPIFPIPLYELDSIIDFDGPLGILYSDI